MDFGLNLILTFTDNATSQLKGVVSSIQNVVNVTSDMNDSLKSIEGIASLSSLAVSADQAGRAMMSIGGAVGGMLTKLVSNVVNVGSEFESLGITLKQLYGSAEAADKQIGKLLQFSATTPFEVEDVKDMIVVLKSQGLEAFKNITGEITNTRQQTMAWLGDLMAFKPDVPASRWRLAFTNYLGSGAPKVLQNVLDMGSIAEVVGHDIGDTVEERMNTLVEFIEKKNLGGLMSEMFGTWQQTISNLDDTFTMLYRNIGNTGAFDNFKLALNNVAGALIELDKTGRLEKLAYVIGDALDPIAQVAIKATELIKSLIISVVDFADEHPKIVKMVTLFSTLFSVIMVAGGAALITLSKFVFALIALSEIKRVVPLLSSLGSAFLSTGAMLGAAWFVWHSNLFGIQTMVFDFVSGCIDAWKVAVDATSKSAEDMMSIYRNLDRNTFFGNLTAGLTKAIVFIRALSDAWADGEMDAELYQKAVDIGVIDLVSRILDLKYRVEEFVKGFKKGWKETNESIKIFVENVAKNLKGTIFEDIFKGAEKFFTLITEADLKDWRNFGKDVGKLAPKLLALGLAFNVLSKAVGGLSTIGTILGGLGKIKLPKLNIASMLASPTAGAFKNFGKVMIIDPIARLISQSSTAQAFSTVGKVITTGIKTSITTAMQGSGIGSTILNGITTAIQAVSGASAATIGTVLVGIIASVLAFAFKDPKGFTDKISQLKDGIVQSFSDLWDRLKTFFEPITDGFNHLKDAFGNLVDSFKNGPVFQKIVDIFSDIGRVVMDVVVPAFNGVVDVVTTVFSNVVNIVSEVFGGVIDIISGIVNIISGIFSGDLSLIVEGVSQIFTAVVNVIGSIFEGAVNVVISIVNAILHAGLGLLEGGIDIVRGVFNTITTFIGDKINSVLTTIQNAVTSIIDLLGFKGAAEKVSAVFDAIKNAISNALNGAKDIVFKAIDAIKGAFNFSWKLPELKLPHVSVSGGEAPFGIGGKGSLPKFDIQWYKQGGVFDKPSVIGVGEAGTEAVMPLENNLQWIDVLAGRIADAFPSNGTVNNIQNIQNVASRDNVNPIAPIIGNTTNNTSNTNNNTDSRSTDNRVIFNNGAIQINMNGSDDVDITNLAKRIMIEIARQAQIQKGMNYGIDYAAGGM